jgi:Zn-dependent protease with chaperone function
MAMNFFEQQDKARKRTGLLVLLFALAVIGIIIALYFLALGAYGYSNDMFATGGWSEIPLPTHLGLAVVVALFTIVIVGGGTGYKLMQLRAGGHTVAESLGGRPLTRDTADLTEKKVLNVVEEMAIASGTPVPPVYMMDREGGINAFAAGYSPNDAVIGVTRGCAERLSRDELQGVIAHEFSHILNGDMRMNIRLIGILHGILIIGIIGYYVLRVSFYSGAGARRSSSSDKKGGAVPILAIALGLMLVGFIGSFFGSLIKAAVSRQREYLADASAVQFTRQPEGIGGALKKIGGYSRGSKLLNPNAPQASHMFFGEGVSLGFTSLFATHPPLKKRISAVLPNWDGEFPRNVEKPAIEPTDRREQREQLKARRQEMLEGILVGGAIAGTGRGGRRGGPQAQTRQAATPQPSLLSQIGAPSEEHVEYARELIASLPELVQQAAGEPFGARAVVYCLLFNRDRAAREQQIARVADHADPAVRKVVEKLLPEIESLDLKLRLTLLDLALPSLRNLSQTQYRAFMENVQALVRADEKIDLFEWSLQRILRKHLVPQFEGRKRKQVRHYALNRLRDECAILLTTLAHLGTRDEEQALQAFQLGAKELRLSGLEMRSRGDVGLRALDAALDELSTVAPKLKEGLIRACAVCVVADREVTVAEAEALRAVADVLDCPMPPLLPGQTIV